MVIHDGSDLLHALLRHGELYDCMIPITGDEPDIRLTSKGQYGLRRRYTEAQFGNDSS